LASISSADSATKSHPGLDAGVGHRRPNVIYSVAHIASRLEVIISRVARIGVVDLDPPLEPFSPFVPRLDPPVDSRFGVCLIAGSLTIAGT
jgi:hypothetical protein